MIQSPTCACMMPSSVSMLSEVPSALRDRRSLLWNAVTSSQLSPRHCTALMSTGFLRKCVIGPACHASCEGDSRVLRGGVRLSTATRRSGRLARDMDRDDAEGESLEGDV